MNPLVYSAKKTAFTLKEALIRPGKAAVAYMSDNRIKYCNIFYLIIILLPITYVIEHQLELLDVTNGIYTVEEAKEVYNPFYLLYTIVLIPIMASLGTSLFKKSNYSISQHLIISGMITLGTMVLDLLTYPLHLLAYVKNFYILVEITDIISLVCFIFIITFGYYQAIGKDYSKLGFFWRIGALIIFVILFLFKLENFVEELITGFKTVSN